MFIQCRTIHGSGFIMADGDNHYAGSSGTPGGGGRIAVHFDTAAQSNATPKAALTFSASGGFRPSGPHAGQGTIYLSDSTILAERMQGGQYLIPGFTSWQPGDLWIQGYGVVTLPPGFLLAVSNNLCITNYGGLFLTNTASLIVGSNLTVDSCGLINLWLDGGTPAMMSVGGNLVVTNRTLSGPVTLNIYSGQTNAAAPDYGVLVNVAGDIVIATNSYLKPWSHPTNGGSPKFTCRTLCVNRGGVFDANYTGFAGGLATNPAEPADGWGPGRGRGSVYGGGGYGGKGGYASGEYGQTYGSSNAPVHPGSGGGGGTGGGMRGGGLIRVEATRIKIYGTLTASDPAWSGHTVGSASGGGIYLRCRYLEGDGSLNANGGHHYTGSSGAAGGGGRIAVWSVYDQFDFSTNRVTAARGDSPEPARWGEPGTIVWGRLQLPGTVIQLR